MVSIIINFLVSIPWVAALIIAGDVTRLVRIPGGPEAKGAPLSRDLLFLGLIIFGFIGLGKWLDRKDTFREKFKFGFVFGIGALIASLAVAWVLQRLGLYDVHHGL